LLLLSECWETNAPNRSFVAWTFVEACIEAQKIIPQVFHKQAVGTRIHIHESINDEAFVESLKRAIWVRFSPFTFYGRLAYVWGFGTSIRVAIL